MKAEGDIDDIADRMTSFAYPLNHLNINANVANVRRLLESRWTWIDDSPRHGCRPTTVVEVEADVDVTVDFDDLKYHTSMANERNVR